MRKIGAPGHEEYGIGAVVEGDPPQLVMNDEAVRMTRPPEGYIQTEMNRQVKEIERQRTVIIPRLMFNVKNLPFADLSRQSQAHSAGGQNSDCGR